MKGSAILNRFLAVAALTSVGISAASATDSGVYVGANSGQTEYDISNSLNFAAAFTTNTSSSTDNSDSMSSVVVGYRFNRAFAAELSYLDLGEATFSNTGVIVVPTGPTTTGAAAAMITGSGSAKGTGLAGIAAIPVGNFEFTLKLGVWRVKTKLDAVLSGQTNVAPIVSFNSVLDEEATTTEAMAAVGMGYTFAEHFHVRLDLSAFPAVGDGNKTGQQDVTALSAGLQYRF